MAYPDPATRKNGAKVPSLIARPRPARARLARRRSTDAVCGSSPRENARNAHQICSSVGPTTRTIHYSNLFDNNISGDKHTPSPRPKPRRAHLATSHVAARERPRGTATRRTMAMNSSRALASRRAPTLTRVARERRPRRPLAAARGARASDAGRGAREDARASSDGRARVVSARARWTATRARRARARGTADERRRRGRTGGFVPNGNDDAGRRRGTGDGGTTRTANGTYASTSRTRARGRDGRRGAARREEILLTRAIDSEQARRARTADRGWASRRSFGWTRTSGKSWRWTCDRTRSSERWITCCWSR